MRFHSWPRFLIAVILVLTIASCGGGESTNPTSAEGNSSTVAAEVTPLLPGAAVVADILGLPATGRTAQLTARVEAALAGKEEWLIEYVSTVPPGQPLPYHENLGLSSDEYDEYLVLLDSLEAGSVGEAEIGAEPSGVDSTTYVFRGGHPDHGYVDGFELDLASFTFTTPFGTTTEGTPWTTPDPDAALGPASGWRWEAGEPPNDLQDGSYVRITLAVRDSDGRVYLGVRASTIQGGALISRVDLDLLCDATR